MSTVSVVLCTYNGSLYVKEQILSILSQSYPVHELLVFDDGSTDDTVAIIEEIATGNPVIRIFKNGKNIGFNRNFEQALLAASGDVIAPADQDDIWLADKIKRMMEVWRAECPLIYCHSLAFRGDVPAHPVVNPVFRYYKGKDPRKIFMRNLVSGHALMIRRSFLPLVLSFKEGVTYDWWMAIVASYNGGVQYLEEALVLHRIHDNNVTHKNNLNAQQQVQLQKDVLKLHLKGFMDAPGMPYKHRQMLSRFSQLVEESYNKSFHLPFFLFLLQHRNSFFSYKKRVISIFSHIKHSYRFAKGNLF
jgi:glycosyltransferase involved in cell wall biosynthesis